ncbi:hypothetical protein GQ457_04G019740 [Hibiscus cannabinus]
MQRTQHEVPRRLLGKILGNAFKVKRLEDRERSIANYLLDLVELKSRLMSWYTSKLLNGGTSMHSCRSIGLSIDYYTLIDFLNG